jgi:hypothetical protein
MLDILRHLTRSAEEKRQEQLNAYLDGELRGPAREQFEALLASDPALRAEVAQLRALKEQVAQLPRVRAPRNYTLDPARYGALASSPSFALYPALRVATVLTAFFLMLAVGLDFLPQQQMGGTEPAEDSIALFEAPSEEVTAERVEAPQEPALDAAREAGRSVIEQEVVEGEAAAEAELFDSAALTATEALTDEVGIAALPLPEAGAVEEAAEEALAQEALATPAPPGAEPAAAPLAATEPAPDMKEAVEEPGLAMAPLRLAQILLGALLLVLLVATLVLRRRLV